MQPLARWITTLALVVALVPAAAAAQADCTLSERFKGLRDQLPDVIGDCTERERLNPANGNVEQATTGGLLYWRKADGRALFTDGGTTWAVGPQGLQSRPNGEQFDWEAVASATQTAPDAADVVALAAPSIVQVVTETGTGSAIMTTSGLITNEHVIRGAQTVAIITGDGSRGTAQVSVRDANLDAALLMTDLALPALQLEPARMQRVGDTVLVLGYPGQIGSGPPTLTRGLISAVREEGGVTLLQTDAAMNPGNSGGAVLNMRGKVVGMPRFGLREAQGLNFAIGAESFQAWLASPTDTGLATSGPPTPTRSPGRSEPSLDAVLASRCYRFGRDVVLELLPITPSSANHHLAEIGRGAEDGCRAAGQRDGAQGVECFEWAHRLQIRFMLTNPSAVEAGARLAFDSYKGCMGR